MTCNLEKTRVKENSVIKYFLTTCIRRQNYNVAFYSLEMILAIGFRVRSKRERNLEFGQNQTPKNMIRFLMDDERFKKPDGKIILTSCWKEFVISLFRKDLPKSSRSFCVKHRL